MPSTSADKPDMAARRLQSVVLFSTADWDAPYRTNKQHVAAQLAQRGVKVLYIESVGLRRPGANARDLRRIWLRLIRGLRPAREAAPNLWVFSPLTIPIGHRYALVRWLNGALLGSKIRSWLKRNGETSTSVWAYHPYIFEAIEGVPVDWLIYHCVDDVATVPGIDAAEFTKLEETLLRRADHVFATSPYLLEKCARVAAGKCSFESNVADLGHFATARTAAPPADLARIPAPRLLYAGVLSNYKLDFALVEACVLARPDWHWVFVGDEPERQADPIVARLAARPNVHLLGYRAMSVLPAYLAGADIAVLPNRTAGHMRGVFPMKFYEYLAAGKPVVATPLDALTAPQVGALDQVSVADGVENWISAIDVTLHHPPAPLELNDPQLAPYSWEVRMDRMLRTLNVS